MNRMEEKMSGVGFELPIQEYKKKDPRGCGHGFFTASWTECSGMEVTKHSFDKREEYSMLFGSFEDFKAWADDCT
jgi:hypothetical protein